MKGIKKIKKNTGIILQIYLLLIVGLLVSGAITYLTQYRIAEKSVKEQREVFASEIADEVIKSVRQYPAYRWLINYWHTHPETLEIEYDADFYGGHETHAKYALLNKRHPDLEVLYAHANAISALPREDQKLFAEVIYSWLLTRVDQIKQSYHVNYLFCVLTDTDARPHPFEKQFFLFSGGEPGSKRAARYESYYPLGMIVSVRESQKNAMRVATEQFSESSKSPNSQGHLADAGNYVDYYACLAIIENQACLIGMTFDLSSLQAEIWSLTWRSTAVSVLFQFLLVQLIAVFLMLFGISPLKKVLANIRQYTQTKDSATVTENLSENLTGIRSAAIRRNEIGQLSVDFIALTHEVDDYVKNIETITAEQQRISSELDLAARIQASMLPSIFPPFPERHEMDIYAVMDPAKEVGGDFYDFYMIDNDHLGIVIADVSGKGVPAALFMMISKVIVQSCAMLNLNPAQILKKTNEAICSNNGTQMFITVWMGILEISTGILKAANAGHEYPYFKRGDRYEMLRDNHGFVIGGLDSAKYREYEITLQPGDALFIHTDGVTEANNHSGELFGRNRLENALNKDPDAEAKTIIANVKEAVDAFVKDADQFDDLTMLCLKYYGPDSCLK